jgi:hypothetical protein
MNSTLRTSTGTGWSLVPLTSQMADFDGCHFSVQNIGGQGQFNSADFSIARSSEDRPNSTTWAAPIKTTAQTTLTLTVPQTTSETTSASITMMTSTIAVTQAEGGQTSPSPTQTGDSESGKPNRASSPSSPTYKKPLIGVGAAIGALALVGLVAWIVILLRRRRRSAGRQNRMMSPGRDIPPPLTEMGVAGHEAWVPRPELAATPTPTPTTLTVACSSSRLS